MYENIKEKHRFLVFDVGGIFLETVSTELIKEIEVRNIPTVGFFDIDVLEILEGNRKVVCNIPPELVGTDLIASVIQHRIEDAIKYKGIDSGNFTIAIVGNNISQENLLKYRNEASNLDISIIAISI
jgi:hypothetical protein